MFLYLSVICPQEGVSASVHAGIHTSHPGRSPLADTPQQTATAADGTHPTGMHSCYKRICCKLDNFLHVIVRCKCDCLYIPASLALHYSSSFKRRHLFSVKEQNKSEPIYYISLDQSLILTAIHFDPEYNENIIMGNYT